MSEVLSAAIFWGVMLCNLEDSYFSILKIDMTFSSKILLTDYQNAGLNIPVASSHTLHILCESCFMNHTVVI
jgi:hypothetical protein